MGGGQVFMIISTKRIKEWLMFLFLFVLFTLLVYQVMAFFSPLFEPNSMYKEPTGDAVKVFADYGKQQQQISMTEQLRNRLLWFYQIGE